MLTSWLLLFTILMNPFSLLPRNLWKQSGLLLLTTPLPACGLQHHLELKGVPSDALNANAGFVTFVVFPRHVEGKKLDTTVWSLLTFHAYVSYHVKCSEGFMHTRMRRRVESLIQALDRAKSDAEKLLNGGSFKKLSLKNDGNSRH